MDHFFRPIGTPSPSSWYSPLAAVTYLSCILDSASKRHEALQRRLGDAEKNIETSTTSKERRKHKRKRCYILHDIQLCHSEIETLIGAVDASWAQIGSRYHQEIQPRRQSYATSGLYLPLMVPQSAVNPYIHLSFQAPWQYRSTPWGLFPEYFDPYAAAAPQYTIQQALVSNPPLSYPQTRRIYYEYQPVSPLSHEPCPSNSEFNGTANQAESTTNQDIAGPFAGLSLRPAPLSSVDTGTTSRASSRVSSDIAEPLSTTPTSLEELPVEDIPIPPPGRRY